MGLGRSVISPGPSASHCNTAHVDNGSALEDLDPTGCGRVRPEEPKTRGTRPGVRSHTARSSGRVLCQPRFCRQPGHPQPVAEGSDFTTCWPECLILLQISEYTFEARVPKSPGHISTSTHWLLTVNPAGTRAWGTERGIHSLPSVCSADHVMGTIQKTVRFHC